MSEPTLKRSLNTWDLVVYGIMFMIPVAPFAWYGTFIGTANGMVALAYLIGLVAMLFTGFSYAQMSSRYPVAGSVYSYVQRGTRQELGWMAGWAIMLDYIFLPAVAYLIGALYLSQLVSGVTCPSGGDGRDARHGLSRCRRCSRARRSCPAAWSCAFATATSSNDSSRCCARSNRRPATPSALLDAATGLSYRSCLSAPRLCSPPRSSGVLS
jgi:amino acid transporter